jgi:hypothetical protein
MQHSLSVPSRPEGAFSVVLRWTGLFLALVSLPVLLLFPPQAAGQSTLGTILGRVSDSSGAALPQATVTLINENTNVTSSTTTGSTGDYVFSNLIPSPYRIKVTAAGFADYTVNHVVLNVNQTVRQDATLKVGSVSTSLEVTAEIPVVQTDTSSVGTVVESQQVSRIPLNGRTDMFGLLALVPGVQGAGANARISGNSWRGGAVATMDGLINMEMENSRLSDADPSLESVQEFKVVSSTASAEYGAGTAQVIVATKSGTNSFHGSAFEYNRVKSLTAKSFFATSKPPYTRNEYGASLGGPVKKNKLFFFGSYEAYRYRTSSTMSSAQPSTALVNGDFTGLGTITDPLSGSPFPDNKIPVSRFSSISKTLLPYFVTPNIATSQPGGLGTNYIINLGAKQDNYRYEGRLDYTLDEKNSFFIRYYKTDRSPAYSPGVTEKMGGVDFSYWMQSMVLNYTHVFTPSIMNVLTVGKTREADHRLSQNSNMLQSTLIPGVGTVKALGLPSVGITGFTGLGDDGGSADIMPTYQISDTLTWVKSAHTIKAGFSALRYCFHNWQYSSANFSFTGAYSGNAFADFLLGDLMGSSRPLNTLDIAPLNYHYGFFFQDDWRLTPKLTVNIGMRYEVPTKYTNDIGGMANWYPELNQIVVLKGDYNSEGYPTLPLVAGSSVGRTTSNYVNNDLTQFSPRLGFAYRPLGTSRLVVRAGAGIFYDTWPWTFGTFALGNNPPFAGTQTFEPTSSTTPTLTFDNPFPVGTGKTVSNGISANAIDPNVRYPRTYQWNLTVESEVMANTSVRATYLGSERVHASNNYPINSPATMAPGDIQSRRPYQPFGNINYYQNNLTANTQQLQLSLARRFASGLSFGVDYQLTHALAAAAYDLAGATDPLNLRLDRGNDPNIRRHYMTANYVYELPFGKGRQYANALPSVLDAIIGGWETSGLVTLGSGLPYSVTFSSNLVGWRSNYANRVGDPSVEDQSIKNWFNPAAFAKPDPYTYGNAAPYSLFGPGFSGWDMGLYKNFRIKELAKLQFRSEFFNTLNHPCFGNPASNISATATVGKITWTTNTPRTIQFALRAEF